MRRMNWPLWSGLAVSILAFLSYPLLFVRFPITRDVPWASFLLFAVGLFLVVTGLRRAQRKLVPSIVTGLSAAILAIFCFLVFVFSRQLPSAAGAPTVGQKAPDFVLPDTEKRPVALTQLLTAPGTKGVLLIFYRGYW